MRVAAQFLTTLSLAPLLACHPPAAGANTTPTQAATASPAAASSAAPTAAPPAPVPPEIIEAAIGIAPKVSDDGVVKVTWPRDQTPVQIDGMPFPPAAGLTAWAAFAPTPRGAMVMGDTVVFQDEVDAAMDAAFAGGLEVTALHNHFFFDEPKVYFMHIGGHGPAADLASAVRRVWDAIRAVRAATSTPARGFAGQAPVAEGTLSADALGHVIGTEAKPNGAVVKAVFGRQATMHDTPFGASMGLTTWAAFTGSDEHAAMDGDFAMTAAEVQPVLRALRANGVHVVALHNHMLGESPAYYFTHFWGRGQALELAKAFRAALDAQRRAATRH